MKMSMLTRLVSGLIILSLVFGSGAETANSFEGWSFSALILALIATLVGAYLGVYLFLKGMKDAVVYINS